jgi:GT2 family glycosyltransferase
MQTPAPTGVDIIILSNTNSPAMQRMTEECISSLLASENPVEIRFNVVIIESCKSFGGYEPRFGRTITPRAKFGFNKFLNIGIRETRSDYVCLCNNDLIFHPGWAANLLAAMRADPRIESCCPYCSIYHSTKGMEPGAPPAFGYYYEILIGWCIFVRRSVLDRIGPLDEKITFWFAERDYGNTLEAARIVHALVSTSRVDHLGSRSIKECGQMEQARLTDYQQLYYDYKWRHRSRLLYFWQTAIYFPRLMGRTARSALNSVSNSRKKSVASR